MSLPLQQRFSGSSSFFDPPDASSSLSIDQMVCLSGGKKSSLRLLRSTDLAHVSDFRLPSTPYRLLTLSCDSDTSLVVAVSFKGFVGIYDVGRRRRGEGGFGDSLVEDSIVEDALVVPRAVRRSIRVMGDPERELEDLGAFLSNLENTNIPGMHRSRVYALGKKMLGGSEDLDEMLILTGEDGRRGSLIVWKPDFSAGVLDCVWEVNPMPPNLRSIVSGSGVFGDEIVYAGGGRLDGEFRLMRFDLEKMKRLSPLVESSLGHIEGISLVEETSQIVVASYNGNVVVFDPREEKHVGHFRAGSYCYSVRKFMELSPPRIVLGMYSGRLRIYDPRLLLPSPELACEEVPAHPLSGQIWSLTSLSDSAVLSGSSSQSVAKSCVRTGKLLARAEFDRNSQKFGGINGICSGYDAMGLMGLGARLREESEERWTWGWSFVLQGPVIGIARVLVAGVSLECVRSFLIVS